MTQTRQGTGERLNFSRISHPISLPNLIDIQRQSYEWFLDEGLREVFEEVSPIDSYTGKNEVTFGNHEIGEPKRGVEECKAKDLTYSVPINVQVTYRILSTGAEVQQPVFMGEIPLMTDRGTFIINGTERVVVSQLVRSPGVYFNEEYEKTSMQSKLIAKMIPARGAWLEFETEKKDILGARVDRKRRFPATVMLKALGIIEEQDILEMFEGSEIIQNTLEKDTIETEDEAFVEIFKKYRQGEAVTLETARNILNNLYFNNKRYDLAKVGRYKINRKLSLNVDPSIQVLTRDDIIEMMKYTVKLHDNISGFEIDDIDHFGNRRVRAVGELVQNQVRIGLARMEKTIKEKMSTQDADTLTPKDLMNIRPVTSALREFFGSSQLSQFMDQTNPLSGLTNKRRLSALGPGGLSRDRAGFEVRDVHASHYGRMCPIETPEGPNIGLIGTLATYAKLNHYGFIETPYRIVKNGKVSKETRYLTADEESRYVIAQANAKLDSGGGFKNSNVLCRTSGGVRLMPKEKIEYMDVSPAQIVSVATALIPFLEHNDANRALMGSNMQRQAVPLMQSEPPIIGTGIEYNAAKDTGEVVIAKNKGEVTRASSHKIEILTDPESFITIKMNRAYTPIVSKGDRVKPNQDIAILKDFEKKDKKEKKPSKKEKSKVKTKDDDELMLKTKKGGYILNANANEIKIRVIDEYDLLKFQRSNQGTCVNQKPIVSTGQKVEAGDVIADGPATSNGEIALGKNLLVAFMPWEGYNYEDAIIISENLVMKDTLSSVHIEKYEIEARETKLGPEQITREIPNVSEEALKNIDENGVIRVGAEVKPGDILVGKVTYKGETDQTAEEKLLRAIFSDKARDVKDTSLRVPNGEYGKVIEVREFSREKEDELSAGVIKLVRVFIAQKRRISVGDKLAGRHGNKGVIAQISPIEDMPYMADGTPIDIILNPLGVPSRMNLGQVLEAHLGWAAMKGWTETDGNRKVNYEPPVYISTPVFDGAGEEEIKEKLGLAGLPQTGKTVLYDGKTGEPYDSEIAVGYVYVLKLAHLVDDKIHARSTGPYALVTQQPLGGKAQFGGQRFGEMEVWALEAYGAAYTLQELLTVKSDDIYGRVKIYEAICRGRNIPEPNIPQSFKVLMMELRALGLNVEALTSSGESIEIKEYDESEDLRMEDYGLAIYNRASGSDLSTITDDYIDDV